MRKMSCGYSRAPAIKLDYAASGDTAAVHELET